MQFLEIDVDTRPGNYYVSVINGKDYRFLAGPYASHREALEMVPIVRRKAEQVDPRSVWYEFGTARIPEDAAKPPKGMLNDLLPARQENTVVRCDDMILRGSNKAKLSIGGTFQEGATEIVVKTDDAFWGMTGPEIEFWPDGLSHLGYGVLNAGYTRMTGLDADGHAIIDSFEVFGAAVVKLKPVWWRRLLFEVFMIET